MINIKKIKPMFNGIITTMDKYDDDTKVNGLIVKSSGTLMEFQKVIAVGTAVKCMKEGDLVCIDPKRYAVMKHQDGSMKDGVITDNPIVDYNFNIVNINGETYLYLYDSDVRSDVS